MPTIMTHPGRSRRWMIALLIAFVGLRIIFAPLLELIPDEAYYWTYSRHLDIGYLDHPPLIAWLIRIGTGLFGQTELGVRLPALVCGLLTIGFLTRLASELHGRDAGLAAAVLAAGLPFFFAFGAIATPDPPLIAAWAVALLYLKRALIDGRAGAWWGVGIAFGLGLLAKYTMVLLGLSVFVFMLVDPEARRWFARPQPYLAALLALLLFSPVLVWNAQHGWISFTYQLRHGIQEEVSHPLVEDDLRRDARVRAAEDDGKRRLAGGEFEPARRIGERAAIPDIGHIATIACPESAQGFSGRDRH